jgi:glucose-6-phosphate isomerase
MLGVWYRNFYDYPAHLLLPYDTRLGKIAKFTQQMDMESNGKAVDREGNIVNYTTGPFYIW